MTVTRNINGKEISVILTAEELTRAYYEQQQKFDMEDMETAIRELDDSDFAKLGTTRAEAISLLPALADDYREALDNQYSVLIDYADTVLETLSCYFNSRK